MTAPKTTNSNTSNLIHDTIVDVAIGIVVDKLSAKKAVEQAQSTLADNQLAREYAGQSILISKRRADQVLAGYWELPGGKVEHGESARDTVIREVREEVGIEVRPIHTLPTVEHVYEHAHVRLMPFVCTLVSGIASAIEVDQIRWVSPNQLDSYNFPKASQPVIAAFLRWLDQNASATT